MLRCCRTHNWAANLRIGRNRLPFILKQSKKVKESLVLEFGFMSISYISSISSISSIFKSPFRTEYKSERCEAAKLLLLVTCHSSLPDSSRTLRRVLADSSRAKCSGRVLQESVKTRRCIGDRRWTKWTEWTIWTHTT